MIINVCVNIAKVRLFCESLELPFCLRMKAMQMAQNTIKAGSKIERPGATTNQSGSLTR